MSEFTDFERTPDQGALSSCFAAIADCHYYVLLVGMRRGSWFQQEQRISVTQQEFRTAMDLAAEGKITPVVFVRAEVEAALRFGGKRRPKAQASATKLQDSDHVRAFLEEIRASKFEPPVLTGQADTLWYYTFNDFYELLPALRVNLHLHRSVRRQALLANLRWELIENIAGLCISHKG